MQIILSKSRTDYGGALATAIVEIDVLLNGNIFYNYFKSLSNNSSKFTNENKFKKIFDKFLCHLFLDSSLRFC